MIDPITSGLSGLLGASFGAWMMKLIITRHVKRIDAIEIKQNKSDKELTTKLSKIELLIALMQKDLSNLSKLSEDHETILELKNDVRRNREELEKLNTALCNLHPSR